MTLVEVTPSDDLCVILCLSFDRCASGDAVEKFKRGLLDCASVVRSVEATGAFDFMIEAELRDFAGYHALLDAFASELATLVERHEASFVCRHFRRVSDVDQALWVPCRDGRRRVDCAAIELVRAEGDYVRLHCGTESWLVHDTMHHMREILDPTVFLTLHRSTIVNANFIKRLAHLHKHWVAVLGDGTEHRIAKSHVAATLAALRPPSSTHNAGPPIGGQLSDASGQPTEKPMRAFDIPAILR